MQRLRRFIGLFFTLSCTLALAQVPGTVPPIKLPPSAQVKPIPGAAAVLEARRPFIARYAYCNAMQLYQSRRAAWEPIYRDAGATNAELDAYSANLVTYLKEFCSNGRPANYWQEALARVEAFDKRVDSAMATSLGISLEDATALRISRVLALLEKLRERCLGGGQPAMAEDLMSVFGSALPATSTPPGVALDPKPAAMSLAKCSTGGDSAGATRGSSGVDRETLGACVARALAQSDSCASPIGDEPAGEVVRREDLGAGCSMLRGTTEICGSGERRVYANGGYVEVTSSRVSGRGKDGREHEVRVERRRTIGTGQELVSDYTRTFYDGKNTGISGRETENDVARMITEEAAVREGLDLRVPRGYRALLEHFVAPGGGRETHRRRIVPARSGPGGGDSCASTNPGSSMPLGFAHIASGDGGRGNPIHAGRLDTWDMAGQCVCNSLGRLGPGLAASSGFRCAPDENTRRLDCLLNPSGPADGIRPECVRYLQEDNPGRDTRTTLNEWCGRVAQCPPGAALASASASGGAVCSCSTGLASPTGRGGGTPGGSTCSRVTCAHGPGSMGSDLYRQCCGVPGESPGMGDPSAGPPVPRPRGPPEMPKLPLPLPRW